MEDLDLPNPVIRSHYGNAFAKQYVRDDRLLRTEPATNNVYATASTRRRKPTPPPGLQVRDHRQYITRSNKTSWRPSSTAANCGNWASPRPFPTASVYPF